MIWITGEGMPEIKLKYLFWDIIAERDTTSYPQYSKKSFKGYQNTKHDIPWMLKVQKKDIKPYPKYRKVPEKGYQDTKHDIP